MFSASVWSFFKHQLNKSNAKLLNSYTKITGFNNDLRIAVALPVKRAMYAKFTDLMT